MPRYLITIGYTGDPLQRTSRVVERPNLDQAKAVAVRALRRAERAVRARPAADYWIIDEWRDHYRWVRVAMSPSDA